MPLNRKITDDKRSVTLYIDWMCMSNHTSDRIWHYSWDLATQTDFYECTQSKLHIGMHAHMHVRM